MRGTQFTLQFQDSQDLISVSQVGTTIDGTLSTTGNVSTSGDLTTGGNFKIESSLNSTQVEMGVSGSEFTIVGNDFSSGDGLDFVFDVTRFKVRSQSSGDEYFVVDSYGALVNGTLTANDIATDTINPASNLSVIGGINASGVTTTSTFILDSINVNDTQVEIGVSGSEFTIVGNDFGSGGGLDFVFDVTRFKVRSQSSGDEFFVVDSYGALVNGTLTATDIAMDANNTLDHKDVV